MHRDFVTDLRARMGRELDDWMRLEGLSPVQAAQQLGLSENTLSQLVREQHCDLSIGELLKAWFCAGGDAEIVLRRPASGRTPAQISCTAHPAICNARR